MRDVELVGRGPQLAELTARLRERRLVTVIGPAGIGKTALALAVAARAGADYPLGAHVVDLTRIDDAADVAGAIAAQLGFASFEALLSSPTDQPALIVVDNCEHVAAAAADGVQALLASCASPRVLATSRSPLDLPGESLLLLGPLAIPPADHDGGTDRDVDAVRLFLARARDAGVPDLTGRSASVADLCRRLDGVPLALELAAARCRSMQPEQIIAQLDAGRDVLTRSRFRGHPRHRSLTDTVAWSHRLLPAAAAALLDRLGVLTGPFDLEVAVAVGDDIGLDEANTVEAIAILVDSSLVTLERPARGGPPLTRYRIFQSIRLFTRARLTDQGELDEAHSRLADHVTATALALIEGFRSWDLAAFGRLSSLYDHAAASLRWCLAHDDDGRRGRVICTALWGLVHQIHTDEIAALSDAVLRRWPDPAAPFAADAIATAATARFLTGDPAGALAMADAALPYADASTPAPLTLRRVMAYAAVATGDPATALALCADLAVRARADHAPAMALEAEVNRAMLLWAAGELTTARSVARAAVDEAAARGLVLNRVWADTVVAQIDLIADPPAGLAALESAVAAASDIGYPVAEAVGRRALAWGRRRTGDLPGAARELEALFDLVAGRGGSAFTRSALLGTAEVLHAAGHPGWPALFATGRALPVAGPATDALDSLIRLPPTDAGPLGRRDAIALARRELRGIRHAETGRPGAAAGPVRSRGPGRTAAAVPMAAGDPAAGTVVDRGSFVEVTFAGRTAMVKATKGMADIARLLAGPERELHCLELMGGTVQQPAADVMVDAQARAAYRHRIRDLQERIDDAEAAGDLVRAERARLEMDALVEHLATALGIGGRARRSAGSVERARSAVTQRIRGTIRSLAGVHPEFARHLERSVVTGVFCAYRPEHPITWSSI